MKEFLLTILGKGKYGICNTASKVVIAFMICHNKDLSDSKVKNICKMMEN